MAFKVFAEKKAKSTADMAKAARNVQFSIDVEPEILDHRIKMFTPMEDC